MNINEMKEIENGLVKLTDVVADGSLFDKMTDKERESVANVYREADNFMKAAKTTMKAYIVAGGSIEGVRLGNPSITGSVSDWPSVRGYMVDTYGMDEDELNDQATISMTVLYRLDREGSNDASKSEADIKDTYAAWLNFTEKSGSLKV